MAGDPDANELIEQLRAISLALPEATEKQTWGEPTFRVRDKIFVGAGFTDGPVDFAPPEVSERSTSPMVTISMKATHSDQAALLERGAPFFRPKYVGQNGWIGIVLSAATDWDEVEELVMDSYCLVAPKKLARLLLDDLDVDL